MLKCKANENIQIREIIRAKISISEKYSASKYSNPRNKEQLERLMRIDDHFYQTVDRVKLGIGAHNFYD